MPFPPFIMDGPHYHAPMKTNINVLPFANGRANSPYLIAENNARSEDLTY